MNLTIIRKVGFPGLIIAGVLVTGIVMTTKAATEELSVIGVHSRFVATFLEIGIDSVSFFVLYFR